MNTRHPDFITVDMRGLKAALLIRAQARRESMSVLVRRAVARELGQSESVLNLAHACSLAGKSMHRRWGGLPGNRLMRLAGPGRQ